MDILHTRSASPWIGWVRDLGRVVTDAIFPRKCSACGAHWSLEMAGGSSAVSDRERGVPGRRLTELFDQMAQSYLCHECIRSFEPVSSPLCPRCGVMFPSRSGDDHLCGECLRHPAAYRRARAAGVYAGGLMALIHHLKYKACLALGDPLGRLLQEVFRHHWPSEEVDMVLPIPLHGTRWRQRGFNQAQMMVDAWARRATLAGGPRRQFPKARQILVRSKPTIPQTGLGKQARRRNIRGAFTVVAPKAVKGGHILLVDDVYTTGATADEAARVLKRNGAARVDILTVARTMPAIRSQRATAGMVAEVFDEQL